MSYIPQITVPQTAKTGEIIEIKTLMPHKMLPAQPSQAEKQPDQPPKFIEKFTAEFNGKPVFSAKLTPEVSANPYISFYMKVTEAGTFTFSWRENNDRIIQTVQHPLTLT